MKILWFVLLVTGFLMFSAFSVYGSYSAKQGYRYFFYVKGEQVLTVIGVNETTFRVYNLTVGGIEKLFY